MEKKTYGVYAVVIESENEVPVMRIFNAANTFEVRYSADNFMFGLINELMGNEKMDDYLESVFSAIYLVANCTPDLEFIQNITIEVQSLVVRLQEKGLLPPGDPLSDEEDAKIIEEEKLKHEMNKEIADETAG